MVYDETRDVSYPASGNDGGSRWDVWFEDNAKEPKQTFRNMAIISIVFISLV